METSKKQGRYKRLYQQIGELQSKSNDLQARIATMCAVLHYKMEGFFWTGVYALHHDRLIVSLYQGPVACMELPKDQGVCWNAINQRAPVIVPDVSLFPGHITCDSRSKSEIAIPLFQPDQTIYGVLDVDSNKLDAFDETDAYWLQKITVQLHK